MTMAPKRRRASTPAESPETPEAVANTAAPDTTTPAKRRVRKPADAAAMPAARAAPTGRAARPSRRVRKSARVPGTPAPAYDDEALTEQAVRAGDDETPTAEQRADAEGAPSGADAQPPVGPAIP